MTSPSETRKRIKERLLRTRVHPDPSAIRTPGPFMGQWSGDVRVTPQVRAKIEQTRRAKRIPVTLATRPLTFPE